VPGTVCDPDYISCVLAKILELTLRHL